jgi:hypothetical protein
MTGKQILNPIILISKYRITSVLATNDKTISLKLTKGYTERHREDTEGHRA